MNEVESYRISEKTGEIIDTYYDNDKVIKVSGKTMEYLTSTIPINKGKKYTMVIDNAFKIISTLGLTSSAYDVLMVMISNLGFESYSNYVIKTENKRFSGFMNGKEIMNLTTCSDSAFKQAIKQLEKLEIIKKVKAIKGRGNNFIVNPFIITHNKEIPKEIFEMFQDSIFNYTQQKCKVPINELKKRIKENEKTIEELKKRGKL